jgi:hypothetical protein
VGRQEGRHVPLPPCFRAGCPVLEGRSECPLPRSGAGDA